MPKMNRYRKSEEVSGQSEELGIVNMENYL
jgi:hypothetical protein